MQTVETDDAPAQVLGPPAWDPDFQTADLPMIMNLAHLAPAYRRRFLRG